MTGSVFGGGFKQSLLDTGAADNPGDPLNLILKSFVPHIAVYGSQDVDDLVREKGFGGGLWELLRPFGERIQGKVTIRDSNGGARAWDDFSYDSRFGEGIEEPEPTNGGLRSSTAGAPNGLGTDQGSPDKGKADEIAQVEELSTVT